MEGYVNEDKWVNLSKLPRKGKLINWAASIGYTIPFKYNECFGEIIILEKNKKSNYKIGIHCNVGDFNCNIDTEDIKRCYLKRCFACPIAVTHPNLVAYFVNESDTNKYTYGSNARVKLKCPFCGTIKEQKVNNLVNKGFCCPCCSDGISYPNKFMFSLLTQLNLDFKSEITNAVHGFEWVGKYRYDFYFQKYEQGYFVEMDGGFHRYGETLKNDKCKDFLAQQHGISVIRINCDYADIRNRFFFIKDNVLNSKLNSLLNLQSIDWNEIEKRSMQSNVILSVNLWENNNLSIGEIAKSLHISRDAVRKYLIMATKVNLCHYDSQVSHQRSNDGTQRSKRVALYKNGELLNVFYSAKELSRQSKKLYGVFLDNSSVSSVCRGCNNSIKGFVVKYITQCEYERLLPQFQTIQNECNLQEVI